MSEDMRGNTSSRAAQCRQEILDGLTTVPWMRAPGRVVVCGEDAWPVLCGPKPEDVVVACAELGKGRIVVATEEAYMTGMDAYWFDTENDTKKRLQMNMRKWAAQQDVLMSDLCVLKNADSVKKLQGSCKLAVWCGSVLPSDVTDDVTKFILGGGGLLYGMTPWGWLHLNHRKTLSDMPLYPILSMCGLFYTECNIGTGSGLDVKEALAKNGGLHMSNDEIVASLKQLLPNSGLSASELVSHCFAAKKWRREVLGGVASFSASGSPGGIIVYGDHSYPVLSSPGNEHVVLGCGQVGKGRVAVFAKDTFLTGIVGNADQSKTALFTNLKNWASKYEYNNDSDIYVWQTNADVQLQPGHKIVVWKWAGRSTEAGRKKVLDFVQSGGGLIAGMCPWGWLQLNPGTSLSDMPIFPCLMAAGMCYTSSALSIGDINVTQALQQPNGGHHLGYSISKIIATGDLGDTAEVLLSSLPHLPQLAIQHLEKNLKILAKVQAAKFQACAPSPTSPASTAEQKAWMSLCELLCLHNMGMSVVPGLESFPGNFTSSPQSQSKQMKFESKCEEYHSSGYYLPAGVELSAKVVSVEGSGSWNIRVGSHTDKLYGKEKLRRWPNICCEKTVASVAGSALKMRSPYGGLIYIKSPSGQAKLEILMEGVVEAPYFDLRDPASKQDWARRRTAPGLWADIGGEYITITLPAKSVRDVEDPWEAMSMWDEVVLSNHDLRGSHPSDEQRQFVVCDEQPSAGYMHAGHPIVASLYLTRPTGIGLDPFPLNHEDLRVNGSWGMFHVLGHNMQRRSWTFDGTVEVTCNIFTLHAMDEICGNSPSVQTWLTDELGNIEVYLKGSADFSAWQANSKLALAIYDQLARHFGWTSYKRVFRSYEQLSSRDTSQEVQQSIDEWITVFSGVVQRNLCPLFEFWKIPFTDGIKAGLNNFEAFLPEDEMTSLAKERAAALKLKYKI